MRALLLQAKPPTILTMMQLADRNRFWLNVITYDEIRNPLRYRGYYCDTETEFYYLMSRYYDAETGRFVNADSAISGTGEFVQGYNLFAYCFNNPVKISDETDHWPKIINSIVSGIQSAIKR